MSWLARLRCALSASHRTETWAGLTWCVRCGKEWRR